jgi:PAS domain S-box-containing protein
LTFLDDSAMELVANLPEALVVTRPDGTIVYFNQAAETLTEYSATEVLGQNVTLLIPKPARQRADVVQWLARWATHPDPAQLQFLHLTGRTRSGTELQYSVRVSRFVAKEAPYFAIVCRDVSQELQQQTELKHAHLLTRRILAISEDAILTIDDQSNIQFWNRKAEEVFGYTAEEILGKPLNLLIPEVLRGTHDQHIRAFAGGKQASQMMGSRGEISGLHKSGRVLALEASITKTFLDGAMVLSAHIRDIGERKSTEQALVDSELRFRAVFNQALEAMAVLTPEGVVLDINSAALRLLDGNQPATGAHFWELDWWHFSDQQEVARDTLQADIKRCTMGDSVRVKVLFNISATDQRQLDFSLLPVVDSSGKTIYIIAEARDITQFVTPQTG